jgi:hypothetical protein
MEPNTADIRAGIFDFPDSEEDRSVAPHVLLFILLNPSSSTNAADQSNSSK